MIADVDNDTIKKVGLNLGYNSLTYGANKLRKRQAAMDRAFPWLLVFDISESRPDFFRQIEKLIREGQELGIYSYIFYPHEENDFATLREITKRFDECLFLFKAPSVLITDQTAASLRGIHNAVVCVEAADGDLKSEGCVNAFGILKQNRCLYGVHLTYNEDNMGKVTAPETIRSAIALGILFSMYIADTGVSSLCQDALYAFACSERGEKGQPLITFEWLRDMRHISEKILSDCGYMVISSAGNAYYEFKKVKYAFENSLLEMLQGMQPCTIS